MVGGTSRSSLLDELLCLEEAFDELLCVEEAFEELLSVEEACEEAWLPVQVFLRGL